MADAIHETASPAKAPAVLAPGQLVILREQELDCDLATAIQRVRSSSDTSQSRILIIAPEPEAAVAEGPRLLPPFPTTVGQAVRLGERATLAAIGSRMLPLLGCLERFLGELHEVAAELHGKPDLPRVRLAARHRNLCEILEWADAVAKDLRAEAEGAASGFRTLDLRELLAEAALRVEGLYPRLRVQVQPGGAGCSLPGRAGELAEGLYLALGLTALRIGGRGSITVELTSGRDELAVRVRGLGTGVEVEDPDSVERLRQIASSHRARIVPDLGGVDGTGMTLVFPLGPAAAAK